MSALPPPPPPPSSSPPPASTPPGYAPYQPQVSGTKPPSYLVWSILATLFCCLPFGVVAIVMSVIADNAWAAGRPEEAWAAANKAKGWLLAAVACGLIVLVGAFALGAFAPTEA